MRPDPSPERDLRRPSQLKPQAAETETSMPLVCRKAESSDFPALQQMLELYQYELSDIWHQDLDAQALYGYDLTRHQEGTRYFAHVAMEGSQYVGIALVAPACVTRVEGSWMEQFFILKRHRRSGAGSALARHAFLSHPGLWEVGQMPTNVAAQAFWREVIRAVTGGQFTEVQVSQGRWQGVVQQFHIAAA